MPRPRNSTHPLADAYVLELGRRGYAAATVAKHRQHVDRFCVGHDPVTADATAVAEYLAQLEPATRRTATAVLRSFLGWLARDFGRRGNPAPVDRRYLHRGRPSEAVGWWDLPKSAN